MIVPIFMPVTAPRLPDTTNWTDEQVAAYGEALCSISFVGRPLAAILIANHELRKNNNKGEEK